MKNYAKRVLWLETFCHITGMLVGQMDVILGFLKGREPREVLKKAKDLLASTSAHSMQSRASVKTDEQGRWKFELRTGLLHYIIRIRCIID